MGRIVLGPIFLYNPVSVRSLSAQLEVCECGACKPQTTLLGALNVSIRNLVLAIRNLVMALTIIIEAVRRISWMLFGWSKRKVKP